jgi:hypothetical protein
MRGLDQKLGELFSYVDIEKRVPAKRLLRLVRTVVNEVLAALDGDFPKAYAAGGPERLIPHMLEAFLRSDRSWSSRRKQRGQAQTGQRRVHRRPSDDLGHA